MSSATAHGPANIESDSHRQPDLIPREFLKVIAVWSLIPAYLAAGALLGWLVDKGIHSFPYGIGIGLQ